MRRCLENCLFYQLSCLEYIMACGKIVKNLDWTASHHQFFLPRLVSRFVAAHLQFAPKETEERLVESF